PASTISASGPTTFCTGDSVTLSVPPGATHYSWSTNPLTDTQNFIVVKTSGSYYVIVTTGSCVDTSASVTVTVNSFAMVGSVFSENMGSPSSNTVIGSYTGWQNTAPIVFSSTSVT